MPMCYTVHYYTHWWQHLSLQIACEDVDRVECVLNVIPTLTMFTYYTEQNKEPFVILALFALILQTKTFISFILFILIILSRPGQ